MSKKEDKYTIEDISEAIEDERRRIGHIINYLANKNSKPLPQGFDHDRFLEDIEDLEHELLNY